MGTKQSNSHRPTASSSVYHVENVTRGIPLATRAAVAKDSSSRREGLLKRTGLDEGEGLLITPCEAIHTFGMKFAIDVVFVDKKRTVRKILHAIPRNRIGFCWSADIALELPAGTARETGTEIGDTLDLTKLAQ